jgi:RNA polymerase sigma-70 factor (ECF subfamily)
MTAVAGTLDENTERELVVRAQGGDSEAFTLLTRHFMKRVYRAAYAVLRNSTDAEDVTQETFVRAYQGIDRFDVDRPLFPWLYRIARNLCINRIQRVGKREAELPDFDYFADRSPGPEEATIAGEQQQEVRHAVEKLPDPHRRIIELCHFQECSYREIAEILDIPIGTVMSRLYHARRKLRELLDQEDERGQT